jgi:hypothetical protein
VSKASIKGKRLVSVINTNARFGVFSNAFFEKVCVALKANRFHPFEWVLDFEVTVATEAEEQLVSTEFDVVTHHCRVHSNQFGREGFDNEFHLDCNCTADNLDYSGSR